jgi:hypothetical protein
MLVASGFIRELALQLGKQCFIVNSRADIQSLLWLYPPIPHRNTSVMEKPQPHIARAEEKGEGLSSEEALFRFTGMGYSAST